MINGVKGGTVQKATGRGMTPVCLAAPAALRVRRGRGHTLVELVLVLTIFAMFAMVVVPRMAQGLSRTKLDAAFDNLRSNISFGRARAVATGLRHHFGLDT